MALSFGGGQKDSYERGRLLEIIFKPVKIILC